MKPKRSTTMSPNIHLSVQNLIMEYLNYSQIPVLAQSILVRTSLGYLRNVCPLKRTTVGKTFCSVGVCTYNGVAIESHSQVVEENIVLLNLGGLKTLNDVQRFLFNIFTNPISLW